MDYFDKLDRVIETQFQALREQSISQNQEERETINYPQLVGQLENKKNLLEELVHYKLLQGKLRLSDIPQELRVSSLDNTGYFTVAAHRYASENRNITYLTEVLSLMYEDSDYGVTNGIINHREFHELICTWLNYLAYDKIEFKGDKDFECYFQEQKERHRDFFEAFEL